MFRSSKSVRRRRSQIGKKTLRRKSTSKVKVGSLGDEVEDTLLPKMKTFVFVSKLRHGLSPLSMVSPTSVVASRQLSLSSVVSKENALHVNCRDLVTRRDLALIPRRRCRLTLTVPIASPSSLESPSPRPRRCSLCHLALTSRQKKVG